MDAFTRHRGLVVPLDRANVDTDQIIPKQFLKSIRRTGFGDNLFDAWRHLDEGEIGKNPNERRINHDFVLNEPRYADGSILLARDNFGCGSSREHAVWALQEYGFRCVIAPSFADIFFNNSLKNMMLLVVLERKPIEELFVMVEREAGYALSVDLPKQTVRGPGFEARFEIDPIPKRLLTEGLDDIDATLAHAQAIRTFEKSHRRRMPWVFARGSSGHGSDHV